MASTTVLPMAVHYADRQATGSGMVKLRVLLRFFEVVSRVPAAKSILEGGVSMLPPGILTWESFAALAQEGPTDTLAKPMSSSFVAEPAVPETAEVRQKSKKHKKDKKDKAEKRAKKERKEPTVEDKGADIPAVSPAPPPRKRRDTRPSARFRSR